MTDLIKFKKKSKETCCLSLTLNIKFIVFYCNNYDNFNDERDFIYCTVLFSRGTYFSINFSS